MKILITGATSGIGRQLALDYNADGHEVIAIGRNEEALAELDLLGMTSHQIDLTDRAQALDFFATLTVVDLAILNAGTCEYVDLPEFDSAMVARVMRANVESMAISIEGVLPLLRQSSAPHLVGVGSSAAYLPLPRAEAYGASKAAVAYLIDTLRVDLARENIAVSLVSPGFVRTPLTDRNDFPMPMRIEVEEASRRIRKGIAERKKEIHFPKRFTLVMKLFGLLPRGLWLPIAKRMVKK
ncbi:SDR family NAD(P)-dependent oxidoreductase [Desulfopila aestuarii]|uniref:Short-chain dehydrogenase n=1 Tax=Desulfopila aestuarii DSM 18488 TaxID=1121416 RepID=A0A1M7XXL1_9BACT|nr:SDR family NAD(P)-dependent oxidoreductase [Desulfopila aestuarii]SHO43684.1 Short-chain dehydrogenase [Desulfopila aestuarii DSM 18488]